MNQRLFTTIDTCINATFYVSKIACIVAMIAFIIMWWIS